MIDSVTKLVAKKVLAQKYERILQEEAGTETKGGMKCFSYSFVHEDILN